MAKVKTPVEGEEVKEIKKRKRTTKKTVEEPITEPVKSEEVVKKPRKPRVKKAETVVSETPVVPVTMDEVDKHVPYSVPESKHIKHTNNNVEDAKPIEIPGQLKRHGLSKLFANMFKRISK